MPSLCFSHKNISINAAAGELICFKNILANTLYSTKDCYRGVLGKPASPARGNKNWHWICGKQSKVAEVHHSKGDWKLCNDRLTLSPRSPNFPTDPEYPLAPYRAQHQKWKLTLHVLSPLLITFCELSSFKLQTCSTTPKWRLCLQQKSIFHHDKMSKRTWEKAWGPTKSAQLNFNILNKYFLISFLAVSNLKTWTAALFLLQNGTQNQRHKMDDLSEKERRKLIGQVFHKGKVISPTLLNVLWPWECQEGLFTVS